jgi:hypothetical protein
MSIGNNVLGHPSRDRAIATTDLERLCIQADSESLNLSPVHRIKQLRHQGEPLFLAFQTMIQDIARHRHSSVADHDCVTSNPLGTKLNIPTNLSPVEDSPHHGESV